MVRIPTKLADVILYPLQCFSLVQQAVVQAASLLDLCACEKPIQRHTIIEVDHDDALTRRLDEARAVQVRIRIRVKPSTLDKKVHGKLRVLRSIGRRVQIQKEAVLALARGKRLVGDFLTRS